MKLYHGSYISVPTPFVRLGRKKFNHQICILNQEIIDKYLTFKSSETL